jgi:mRNA interferase HicA
VYKKEMKKRELEEALRKLEWSFLRHGAKHDLWSKGEQQEPIPRHAEINEKLARAILRRAARRE